MNKFEKYRKIRRRLELVSFMIAYIIGSIISQCLGISGKKLISSDTALCFVIYIVIYLILNNISIKIADNWYKKNKTENDEVKDY